MERERSEDCYGLISYSCADDRVIMVYRYLLILIVYIDVLNGCSFFLVLTLFYSLSSAHLFEHNGCTYFYSSIISRPNQAWTDCGQIGPLHSPLLEQHIKPHPTLDFPIPLFFFRIKPFQSSIEDWPRARPQANQILFGSFGPSKLFRLIYLPLHLHHVWSSIQYLRLPTKPTPCWI